MDERETFEQNYKLYKGRVTSIIRRYRLDAETVEDLVSHTFMQAWKHRDSFKGQSAYPTWLISIAINSTLNYIAYQKCRPVVNSHDYILLGYTNGATIVDAIISEQEVGILLGAIKKLPLPHQLVVKLSIMYGLTYEEIASSLNIPIGTVRSRYHRARELLKECLG